MTTTDEIDWWYLGAAVLLCCAWVISPSLLAIAFTSEYIEVSTAIMIIMLFVLGAAICYQIARFKLKQLELDEDADDTEDWEGVEITSPAARPDDSPEEDTDSTVIPFRRRSQ